MEAFWWRLTQVDVIEDVRNSHDSIGNISRLSLPNPIPLALKIVDLCTSFI